MIQNERNQKISIISDSLKELMECRFVPMEEYRNLIHRKKLVYPGKIYDDRAFQQQYPTHPMAQENRFKRIKLADMIRDASRELSEALPKEVLDQLHTALFDCCAAVRHSLSQALFYAGDRHSAFFLGKVIEEDGESAIVRRYARVARDRCLMREDSIFHEKRLTLLISKDIELAGALLSLIEKEGATLYMPDQGYTELIAWSSAIQIIDRWVMGREHWDTFCDYLDEVNEMETVYPVKDEDGTILAEEPIYDHTPLIIIDHHLEKSLKKFREPNKPEGKVYYIEEGPVDVVAKLTEYNLKGKAIDISELNAEINRERGGY